MRRSGGVDARESMLISPRRPRWKLRETPVASVLDLAYRVSRTVPISRCTALHSTVTATRLGIAQGRATGSSGPHCPPARTFLCGSRRHVEGDGRDAKTKARRRQADLSRLALRWRRVPSQLTTALSSPPWFNWLGNPSESETLGQRRWVAGYMFDSVLGP